MNYIESHDRLSGEQINLHYQDVGEGQPVVLIHGWPLSHEMWEYQTAALVNGGYRVVAYDRRGFGRSSKPWNGYDYDSLTDDLKNLIEQLDLHDVILVGFSMGGGEAVRYIAHYGSSRISKLVLLGSITPLMLKTPDHPEGVEQSVFDEMAAKIQDDRIDFLDTFGKQFFGVSMLKKPVSGPLLEYYRMLASMASPRATLECAKSFSSTDFRNDLSAIDVPTLIIHGDADATVPIDATARLAAKMIRNCKFITYEGAPHGFFYTEKERLNGHLLSFLQEHVTTGAVL